MANVDIFTVTCDNRDVLEAIKGGAIYTDTVEELAENKIRYEANARFAYDVLEDVSRKNPEAVIQATVSMDADYYSKLYYVTYQAGKDTLNNVKIQYMWGWGKYEGTEGQEEIEKALEAFFAKIDTVTMKGKEYETNDNGDKEIIVTMPIGEGRKVRAKKEGHMIDIEAILEKKTSVTETWEEVEELKPEDSPPF